MSEFDISDIDAKFWHSVELERELAKRFSELLDEHKNEGNDDVDAP